MQQNIFRFPSWTATCSITQILYVVVWYIILTAICHLPCTQASTLLTCGATLGIHVSAHVHPYCTSSGCNLCLCQQFRFSCHLYHSVIPPASEDSDWSKAAESSDWPSLTPTSASAGSDIINPGGDIIITSQDNLESVLEKLGLVKFHSLFQVRRCGKQAMKHCKVCLCSTIYMYYNICTIKLGY